MALFTSSFTLGTQESSGSGANLTGTNVWKDYQLGEELGRGTYGAVYLATKRKDMSKVAIKEIPKRRCRDLKKLRREVRIMERLHHPNVLNLLGHYENTNYMHLALELCSGGEVFEKIAEGMTECDAANITYQTLLAIRHCHDNNIVHRDLKPQNLLLKFPVHNLDNAQLKVVDFGASLVYTDVTKRRGGIHEIMGTISYMAPEVFMARTKGYDYHCDLWSVGVILYQMITGEKPFANKLDIQNCNFNFNAPEWSRVSPQCKSMVSRLMEYDTFKRLNATEALSHPWILMHVDKNRYSSGVGGQVRSPRRPSRPQNSNVRGKALHSEEAKMALRKFVVRGKVSRKLSKAIAAAGKEKGRNIAVSMRKAFDAIDSNGDGTITVEEMRQHVEAAGGVERDVMKIMSDFDMDTDFRISYKEFLENALNRIDCDGDVENRQKLDISKEKEPSDIVPDLEASKTSHASSPGGDAALVSDIKDLIKTYYKAEDDHKLGRLRGKLMKSAKELHSRAKGNVNPKVQYKVQDLIRLGLV